MKAINIMPQYPLYYWRETGAGDVVWAQDERGAAAVAYGVYSVGTTVIIDREGRVQYRDGYATSYETLKAEISKLQ